MEEPAVREHAEAMCAALVAGDVDQAITDFSPELRRNLGEVLALLPLPSVEASVDSIERGGSGFVVVLRLVGESEEVLIQTRWKEREGEPTMIELSHLSKTVTAPPAGGEETEADGGEASAV